MVYAVSLRDDADEADAGAQRESSGAPYARARLFDLHRISIFVKRNVLVTVRLTPDFQMEEVRRRWAASDAMQYGIGALLHGLLDVVADGHFEAVQRLDDEIEDLEGLLFDERVSGRELQRRTYDLRRDLVILRRVVFPMREIIAAIQRRRFVNHAPPELDPHFSDLYDHALHATEWIESLRDMITTVFETNLTLADARLNTVMKKLTGWAAIIAVPMLVDDDLILAHTAVTCSLIPGSLIIDVDRERGILYLHVIGVRNDDDLEAQKQTVLRWERRIVRAVGSRAQLAKIKGGAA